MSMLCLNMYHHNDKGTNFFEKSYKNVFIFSMSNEKMLFLTHLYKNRGDSRHYHLIILWFDVYFTSTFLTETSVIFIMLIPFSGFDSCSPNVLYIEA